MDIIQLVDRLESLFNHAKRVPLTATVMVNEDEFLELIDQLRIAIPEEVKGARRMQQERDRIVTDAQQQADQLTEEARRRVGALTDQHELVVAAKARSEQILRQAQSETEAMRQGADDYVAAALRALDHHLTEVQREVRNGLASLGADSATSKEPPRPSR